MRTLTTLFLLAVIPACMAQTYADLFDLAQKHSAKGEYKKAATYYTRALSAAANDNEKLQCLTNIGYTQNISGNKAAASQAYAHALKIDSTSLPLLMQRAGLLLETDSAQAAIECYNKVEQAMPQNRDVLFFRAYAYTSIGKYKEAKRDYIKLLGKAPDDYKARLGLAMLYQKEGNNNESLMLLETMIEENPRDANLYLARCNMEIEQKQYELALLDIEKAIELEPAQAAHHTLKAEILDALGRKGAAKRSRNTAGKLAASPAR